MTGLQNDDVIQARTHTDTDKVRPPNPWLSISPDEQTVPDRERAQQTSCADLIRMISASYHQQRQS